MRQCNIYYKEKRGLSHDSPLVLILLADEIIGESFFTLTYYSMFFISRCPKLISSSIQSIETVNYEPNSLSNTLETYSSRASVYDRSRPLKGANPSAKTCSTIALPSKTRCWAIICGFNPLSLQIFSNRLLSRILSTIY